MKQSILAVAAVVGALACHPACAQSGPFNKPEDAIRYRKAAFSLMGTHYGRIAAMASGRVPFDAKAAADNAALATMLSKLPFAGFVPGSESGGGTKAKPAIWAEQDKFRAGATRMQEAMVQLDAAARTGSIDAIRTASGKVGQSCKACHDSYKSE